MGPSSMLALADFLPDERELWQQLFPAAGLDVALLPDDVPTALCRIRDLRPDLVVTRIRPKRFGIDLVKAMRSDPGTVAIPVLVLTSYQMPQLEVDARAAGADEVILLPIFPETLCALAWNLIRNGRSSGAAPYAHR